MSATNHESATYESSAYEALITLTFGDLSERERAEAEERVAIAYMSMARRMAARFAGYGADWDDLVQVASLALLHAIRRFDPELGAFEAFASATISGELKRYLRDQCWTVRPPRRVQELHSRIVKATEEVAQAEGAMPGVESLAVAVEANVHDIAEALCARSCYSPASLDTPATASGRPLGDGLADEQAPYEAVEESVALVQICEGLSERDLDLIRLRFYEDLSQREIGERLGISQMQVSRRLQRLLMHLRAKSKVAEVA